MLRSCQDRIAPKIAIFPWGDVIEDFLEPLGLDARTYLANVSGGWLFGYVQALQMAGWCPIIIWASRSVSRPECLLNLATQTSIWLVPGTSRSFAQSGARTAVRRWLSVPVAFFRRILRAEGCIAILVQEYEDPRFDRLVRLGIRLHIPVYVTFQGGDRTGSWLEEWIRPSSLRAAIAVLIPSASERARVAKKYNQLPPLLNVPNPVDDNAWAPVPREVARLKLGIDPFTFVAINHGRIDIRRKGLDLLVAAWKEAASASDQLVIIGSGQDDEQFQALLQTAACSGLSWKRGYTTDRELIRNWLSAADIYVTTSRTEGMPVGPLEAMACGLPLVATDAQGLSDILENGEMSGGLRVPRGDVAAVAAAIRRLRDDPMFRQRLGEAARRHVRERYSISAVSRQLGGNSHGDPRIFPAITGA